MSQPGWKCVPGTVWWLGIFGFLTGASSIIYVTFTPFLLKSLNVDMEFLGFIGGLSEAIAMASRAFIGVLSDRWGGRKAFIVVGGLLYCLGRYLLVEASHVNTVIFARLFDRFGNGIQANPRDALVGDITPKAHQGVSYGLRLGITFAGPVVGALCALPFLMYTSTTIPFRSIFFYGAIPSFLALFCLIFFVKDYKFTPKKRSILQEIRCFPAMFWKVMGLNIFFNSMNFCITFPLILMDQYNVPCYYNLWIMVIQNLLASITSLFIGPKLFQYATHRILFGFIALGGLANIILMLSSSLTMIFLGITCFGFYLGGISTIISAMMTRSLPSHLLGTGFGLINLGSGLVFLISNTTMGRLWDYGGQTYAFGYCVILSVLYSVVMGIIHAKNRTFLDYKL